ncbi:TPA: hypothetical protein I7784_21765 [Vibrio vulnificus]|nr:hypothetical protein [Vibrio vulnificus]
MKIHFLILKLSLLILLPIAPSWATCTMEGYIKTLQVGDLHGENSNNSRGGEIGIIFQDNTRSIINMKYSLKDEVGKSLYNTLITAFEMSASVVIYDHYSNDCSRFDQVDIRYFIAPK